MMIRYFIIKQQIFYFCPLSLHYYLQWNMSLQIFIKQLACSLTQVANIYFIFIDSLKILKCCSYLLSDASSGNFLNYFLDSMAS
jgi:hypothetical protein